MARDKDKEFHRRRHKRLARHKKRRAVAKKRRLGQQGSDALPPSSAFGRLLANFWVKDSLKKAGNQEEGSE